MGKSSRHQKIIGDFGENLVCNWLSRTGFEVAIVDHTGIDIVAYNPKSKKRLGITVKSRNRTKGEERTSVTLFYRDNKDREKITAACKAFGCDEPWIAVYVEKTNSADLYLTSLKHFNKKYRRFAKTKSGLSEDWKMSKDWPQKYAGDSSVKHVKIEFDTRGWFETVTREKIKK